MHGWHALAHGVGVHGVVRQGSGFVTNVITASCWGLVSLTANVQDSLAIGVANVSGCQLVPPLCVTCITIFLFATPQLYAVWGALWLKTICSSALSPTSCQMASRGLRVAVGGSVCNAGLDAAFMSASRTPANAAMTTRVVRANTSPRCPVCLHARSG